LMTKLYTVSEVAKMLKVNRTFVYNLINSGKLPSVKLGSIKIRSETLNKFLEGLENGR